MTMRDGSIVGRRRAEPSETARTNLNGGTRTPSLLALALLYLLLISQTALGWSDVPTDWSRPNALYSWLKGSTPYRPYHLGYHGHQINSMTLTLSIDDESDRHSFRLVIRQHNLAVDHAYPLHAALDCTEFYTRSTGRSIGEEPLRTKWFFKGSRLRSTTSLGPNCSATLSLGEGNRILQISDMLASDYQNYTHEINGVYRCEMRRRTQLIYSATIEVHFAYPKYQCCYDQRPLGCSEHYPKPISFRALGAGQTAIEVDWRVDNDTCVYHCRSIDVDRVTVKIQPTGRYLELTLNGSSGKFNVTGLNPGVSYTLRFQAFGRNRPNIATEVVATTQIPFSIRCSLENFTVFNGSDVSVECVLPRLYMARALNGVLQQDKKYVHKERHNSTHSRLVFKWPAVTRSSVTCFSVAGKENSQTCITVTVRCQPLPDPQHGHAMVKVATRGRKMFFRCDEGYHLLGSKMRRCVSTTSTWDGVQPVCIAFQAPTVSFSTETDVIYLSKGEQRTVTCRSQGIPPPRTKIVLRYNGQRLTGLESPSLIVKVSGDDGRRNVTMMVSQPIHKSHSITCVAYTGNHLVMDSLEIIGI